MTYQDEKLYPELSVRDVQSVLATLAFNNGEQLEDFHIRITRL